MPEFILGMKCKLQVSTTLFDALATGLPTGGGEMSNVKDVTVNLETGEADITTRANNGWRATAATLKDGSVDFEAIFKTTDTHFTAIKDAWLNSTEIAAAVLTGAVAGDQGLAGNFTVTNFSMSQPLEEAVKINVTLKPSSFTNWITLA